MGSNFHANCLRRVQGSESKGSGIRVQGSEVEVRIFRVYRLIRAEPPTRISSYTPRICPRHQLKPNPGGESNYVGWKSTLNPGTLNL